MWITEFSDYKSFIKALLKTYPKSGRGQSRRLAEHLNVVPIVVSQVLARDRHFTPEQALKVAEFFGMDTKTSEYFVFLVSLARAETKDLKAFYKEKLAKIRAESENIKNLVHGREVLSDEDKGIFYSNWYYSGIRILSSMERYQTVEALADCTGLSRAKVGQVVSFLIKTGLCVQGKNGRILRGPQSTHVDNESPFVNNHRRNWREKAREKFASPEDTDFFYSSPVALSEKDAEQFRKQLLEMIKEFSKRVAASPEETTMCLNIDWFKF